MKLFWSALLWLMLWFVPLFGAFLGLYYLITLPLRRQERARFFLDLLETGFKQGHSPERTIAAVAATRDRSVGVRFHLLAAHVQNGLHLNDALARVPSLAPPQMAAVLRIGEKLGDIRKVLPVCRSLLRDGDSQTRGAFNYLLLVALAATPIIPLLLGCLNTKDIMPRLAEIAASYMTPPLRILNIVGYANWIAAVQMVIAGVICVGIAAYVGGPRLRRWIEAGLPPVSDWVLYFVPWRRKRMRRDFGAMLALLLDAGAPEEKAIHLAAAATANRVFLRRAGRAIQDLEAGKSLPAALRHFDDDDEFAWRLANAGHGPCGFSAALSGWMESLDAKAFQQEQMASQLVTTGLVLANGLVVGLVAVGVFSILTSIANEVALW